MNQSEESLKQRAGLLRLHATDSKLLRQMLNRVRVHVTAGEVDLALSKLNDMIEIQVQYEADLMAEVRTLESLFTKRSIP